MIHIVWSLHFPLPGTKINYSLSNTSDCTRCLHDVRCDAFVLDVQPAYRTTPVRFQSAY
jgi:hypothetical protein